MWMLSFTGISRRAIERNKKPSVLAKWERVYQGGLKNSLHPRLASKVPPQNQEERLKLIEQLAHIGLGELRWANRPRQLFMERKVQELIEKIERESSVFSKPGEAEFLASKPPPQNQEERVKQMEQVAHISLVEPRWYKRQGRMAECSWSKWRKFGHKRRSET
jgi:hypothetical protein